jgi:hypothetical protein
VSVCLPVNTQVQPGGSLAWIAVPRINYQKQPCSGRNQTYPAPPLRGLDGSKNAGGFCEFGLRRANSASIRQRGVRRQGSTRQYTVCGDCSRRAGSVVSVDGGARRAASRRTSAAMQGKTHTTQQPSQRLRPIPLDLFRSFCRTLPSPAAKLAHRLIRSDFSALLQGENTAPCQSRM